LFWLCMGLTPLAMLWWMARRGMLRSAMSGPKRWGRGKAARGTPRPAR
jgi:hypothetical protein